MVNSFKVQEWIEAKDALTKAKALELKLRKEICEAMLGDKINGSVSGVIGPYKMSATAKLNTRLDAEALSSEYDNLTSAEKQAIKFKPELIAKEYKKLDPGANLHRYVINKPGTPGLALKGIIEDGN